MLSTPKCKQCWNTNSQAQAQAKGQGQGQGQAQKRSIKIVVSRSEWQIQMHLWLLLPVLILHGLLPVLRRCVSVGVWHYGNRCHGHLDTAAETAAANCGIVHTVKLNFT